MKALVLGSSGQIGSSLSDWLTAHGDISIPYDIARDPREDLRQPRPELDAILRDVDFVYFLAFDVGGSTYLTRYQDTFEFVHNNVQIMARTFELLRRSEKPFIFASSQMANMSFSTYGMLKAIGERYTQSLGGLRVKFWNVYGIEHDPRKTHVISDFINMARQHRRIDMRTTGQEERQFLYSDDCADALCTLMHRYAEVPREAELHITSAEWTTIYDVAGIVANLFPSTEIIPGISQDGVQGGGKNEPDPFILDLWKPETALADGIAKVAKSLPVMNTHVVSPISEDGE